MTALLDLIDHPLVTLDEGGWPHRIYSEIDWSLAHSSSKHEGEHLHWKCTLCGMSYHGPREWAMGHAISHDRTWDPETQAIFLQD